MTAAAPSLLIAEHDDVARLFLAENVPRHIFSVLWPSRLCACRMIVLLFRAVGSVAQGKRGT
jgi:hypothetical protein